MAISVAYNQAILIFLIYFGATADLNVLFLLTTDPPFNYLQSRLATPTSWIFDHSTF